MNSDCNLHELQRKAEEIIDPQEAIRQEALKIAKQTAEFREKQIQELIVQLVESGDIMAHSTVDQSKYGVTYQPYRKSNEMRLELEALKDKYNMAVKALADIYSDCLEAYSSKRAGDTLDRLGER